MATYEQHFLCNYNLQDFYTLMHIHTDVSELRHGALAPFEQFEV